MVETNKTELIPPVKVGDVLKDQEVISSGKKGDGVIKYEGYIIFVNDCKQGDIVTCKIEKVLPKIGIANKL